MKNSMYRKAVDHLHFSNNLEAAVLLKTNQKRRNFTITRKVLLAAVVMVLLASTVYASDVILKRAVRIREIGTINSDFSDTQVMELSVTDSLQGVTVHQMELKPKGYYLFGEGMLFHPSEGFFRVTDEYALEAIEDLELNIYLKKDKLYAKSLRYVLVDGGIVDTNLAFYPLNGKTVLVNLEAEDGSRWPAYLDLETGKCRDVLTGVSEKDFRPEDIPDEYVIRVADGQPFKEGILMQVIVSNPKDAASDQENIYFWVQKGTGYPVQLEMQDCHIAFVVSDTLYYLDRKGNYYEMDDRFNFHKVDTLPETFDAMNNGLVSVQDENGTLDIYDLHKGEIFRISDLNTENEGYDATRNSTSGRIIIVRDVPDWSQMERRVDKLGILDMDNYCIRQITIAAELNVQTHGWLDDERYCVIYEEGLYRYLRIYEFT